ncbi:MAG TPA: hypothetical protein VFU31_24990 [Candidatus Binatia bacterium]|nr:hypothetical protein [Candidatus Binatia bacterium]
MAVKTLTSTAGIAAVPRLHHQGEVVVWADYSGQGSLSLSDVILMVKVPDQVDITDGALIGSYGTAAGNTFKLGVDADDAAIITAGTSFSNTAILLRANAATLPFRVSLSSTADIQRGYTWAKITAVVVQPIGSASVSMSMSVMLKYVAAGNIRPGRL